MISNSATTSSPRGRREPTGTRMDEGGVHIDLDDLVAGEVHQPGHGQNVGAEGRYVAKRTPTASV